MANWKILNREFDDVLSNLTDEQLESWMKDRKENKSLRRAKLKILAKIQSQKIHKQQ